MRSIPLLAVNDEAVFDDIAAAKRPKRRERMQAARQLVVAAYKEYEVAAPEVGGLKVATLTDYQKEAMRHAFMVDTKPMTTLRGNLLERQSVARCPFCGISESSTLDHYLPKEHYPEFSIFPKNLVPSCAVCNTRKRDGILVKGTDVRMFLHPCYDDIPNAEFLAVRTRMEGSALVLSYHLTKPVGMAVRIFRHLKSHFAELNLADRYRRMGLEHLGGQYHAFRRAYGASHDATRVVEKLTEVAEDNEDAFGPNFWIAKLYRALAANEKFCDGGFEVVRVQVQPN